MDTYEYIGKIISKDAEAMSRYAGNLTKGSAESTLAGLKVYLDRLRGSISDLEFLLKPT